MELRKGYKNTELGVIPEDWAVKELSKLTSLMTNGFVGIIKSQYTESDDGVTYIQGYNVEENSFNYSGIKKVTREFHKLHLKSCLQERDLLTIQTGDVGLTTIVPKELVGSNCHALIISRFKKNICYPKYFSFYLNSNVGRAKLKEIEIGTTMKHINVSDMLRFLVPVPTKEEQTAIANTLSDADDLISSLEKLIAKKRNIKQGAMQKLLQPKDDWGVRKLGDFVDYEQPIEYLVSDTEYNDNNQTPVLTAGTTFILGYTNEEHGIFKNIPVIIFDDFTTSIKYVDFPFKAKSSAMKMLIPKHDKVNLRFVYEVMLQIKYQVADHKRHWIGEYSKLEITVPPTQEEQTRIANILSDMDAEITVLENKLDKYRNIKLGMMQNLLTGKIRLI